MSHYFENDMNLKSEIRELSYKYDSSFFTFYSDNGVFSKKNVDYGSKLLLETYLKENITNVNILDVGCGYGFIGIVISILTNSYVDMIDVNKRAIHLTNRNIKRYPKFNGNAFISDAYTNIKNKYNVIITNPPIRVGKDILYKFLFEAKNYSKDNGELWLVIHKDQGAKSMHKKLNEEYEATIENKNKGFYIICAKKR